VSALPPDQVALTWPNGIPDPYQFREVYGKEAAAMSVTEQVDDGRRRVIKVYDVDWDERNGAMAALIGYSTVEGTTYKYISRQVPHHLEGAGIGGKSFGTIVDDQRDYLNSDGEPYLFATKILNGQSMLWSNTSDPDGNPGNFRFFRFSVQYETLPYYVLSDDDMEGQGYVDENGNPDESFLTRYCKIEVEGEDQYLTYGRDQFVIASGQSKGTYTVAPTDFPFPGGKIIVAKRVRVTRFQVPERAISVALINPSQKDNAYIDQAEGTVNSIELFQGAAPAGTMLCEPTKLTPEVSPFGDRVYTVVNEWKYLKTKWNYVFWADAAKNGYNGGFVQIRMGVKGDPLIADSDVTAANQGKRIYDAFDHNKIFAVP
jgi:hypothetical protein